MADQKKKKKNHSQRNKQRQDNWGAVCLGQLDVKWYAWEVYMQGT